MITILISSGLNSKGSQVDKGHVIDKRCDLRQGPEAGKSKYPRPEERAYIVVSDRGCSYSHVLSLVL